MFMFSDKQYELVKWIVQIVLPALITLIATIGKAVGWDGTGLTVIIIGAITTFLGSILKVSNANHQATHITVKRNTIEE